MRDTSNNGANEPIETVEINISKVMEQLTVTAMPTEVVESIVERSDYKDQEIHDLKILCRDDSIICWYNDHCVAYVSPNWDRVKFSKEHKTCRLDTIIPRAYYKKDAFDELASVLKNPELQLETFDFDDKNNDFDGSEWSDCSMSLIDVIYFDNFSNMESVLESINHQLSVKACRIDVTCLSNAMAILPYVKPGVLEKIIISEGNSEEWFEDSETMKKVALLDQWNQAKELEVGFRFDEDFPVKQTTHFKRFHFDEWFLHRNTLVLIRDYIMKHENAEFCSISDDRLNAECYDGNVGTTISPGLSHYTIPGSEYYLEFMIKDKLITIEKKKKKQ